MTFKYFFKTGEHYISHNGNKIWDGDYGYDFEYEVDSFRLRQALAEVLYFKYFDRLPADREAVIDCLDKFIYDSDLTDELGQQYEEDLKQYFRAEALEEERKNFKEKNG